MYKHVSLILVQFSDRWYLLHVTSNSSKEQFVQSVNNFFIGDYGTYV